MSLFEQLKVSTVDTFGVPMNSVSDIGSISCRCYCPAENSTSFQSPLCFRDQDPQMDVLESRRHALRAELPRPQRKTTSFESVFSDNLVANRHLLIIGRQTAKYLNAKSRCGSRKSSTWPSSASRSSSSRRSGLIAELLPRIHQFFLPCSR